MPENSFRSPDSPLTYKVLLVLTTLTSIFFCWLYVTKPTAPPQTVSEKDRDLPTKEPSEADVSASASSLPDPISQANNSGINNPTNFVPPSPTALPGSSNSPVPVRQALPSSPDNAVPLANSQATRGAPAWEETNDRIQHVISAQHADQTERIILEVPVIYQTRGLRLGPEQAAEARRILRALQSYKTLVSKLHQDGKNISAAWEMLLLDAQPIDALRADSPSLPLSARSGVSLPENSSATISTDQ